MTPPSKGDVACPPELPLHVHAPPSALEARTPPPHALSDGVTADVATVSIRLFDRVPRPLVASPARCVRPGRCPPPAVAAATS